MSIPRSQAIQQAFLIVSADCLHYSCTSLLLPGNAHRTRSRQAAWGHWWIGAWAIELNTGGLGDLGGCARGEHEKRQRCEACDLFQHLKRISLSLEFSFLTNLLYQQQTIRVIWEIPNPEKLFPKMGIKGERCYRWQLEPVSGKRIGLPRVNMKNSPTASLPDVPAVIGREERRHLGAPPPAFTLPAHTFQVVTKCTNIRLRYVFQDIFLGFRNGLANALQKSFQNFWTKFIPETGTAE